MQPDPISSTAARQLHLHSGGAQGADLAWDTIGRSLGVPLVAHHYRPSDFQAATPEVQGHIKAAVKAAGSVLGRPTFFRGVELVYRNWFQVKCSSAVFAVASILAAGAADARGFRNKATKAVVSGGTGWAVEMAIQMGKPVYVFDQPSALWYEWNETNRRFETCPLPRLVEHFAGIGSRDLTEQGRKAITQAYLQVFPSAVMAFLPPVLVLAPAPAQPDLIELYAAWDQRRLSVA